MYVFMWVFICHVCIGLESKHEMRKYRALSQNWSKCVLKGIGIIILNWIMTTV